VSSQGRAPLIVGRVVTALLVMLLVGGDVADGVTAHRAASGTGMPGTLVVEGRDRVDYGKPPSTYLWAGRFRSDDGRVSRHAAIADPLPARSARPGARVAVRWLPARPDRVYLRHGSRVWTNWLEAQSVWGLVIVVGLVVWLWRRRLRRPGGAHD
jgi:hypothetical protein